jgi:hypothetical protein
LPGGWFVVRENTADWCWFVVRENTADWWLICSERKVLLAGG